MITLTENQYLLLQQYTGLLDTIEEAFDYVTKSFLDYELTEGDRILGDIFSALGHVATTNDQLLTIYIENKSIQKSFNEFDSVVKALEVTETNWTNPALKQKIILEELHPTFTIWSGNIQKELKPYIES